MFLFTVADLCDKYGFSDGDLLETFVRENFPALRHYDVLADVLEVFVIPVVTPPVEAYRIATSHNPVRLSSINGVDAEHFWDEGLPLKLEPAYVKVSEAQMMAFCRVLARAETQE